MKTLEELENEISIPVVIADGDGTITYVNPPFEAVFGWRREEIAGKPLTTIIPKNLRDAHHLGFSRFLATETPTLLNRPLRLKAITKDGMELDAEHTIIAEKRNGAWVFGATLRPLRGSQD